MKITVSQLRKIIREEVEKVTGAPLKDGGVVNRDSGEILDMDSVPPQYLDYVEVDEKFYRPAEVDILLGDPSETYKLLNWKPAWNVETSIRETANWYKYQHAKNEVLAFSEKQLLEYREMI